MKQKYTAIIKHDSGAWIGWIEEISGVNCQESTKAELLTTLQETLKEALQLNRQEAIRAAGKDFEEFEIAV